MTKSSVNWWRVCLLVAVAAGMAGGVMAEPFPADKMTGDWRMTKTYVTEVDPGVGEPTESEQRLTLTLTFLGGDRCRVVEDCSVLDKASTRTYDYTYSNGEIVFTKMNGNAIQQLKDKMLGLVKASRFNLVRIDDDTFEMRYADLPTLAGTGQRSVLLRRSISTTATFARRR